MVAAVVMIMGRRRSTDVPMMATRGSVPPRHSWLAKLALPEGEGEQCSGERSVD